MTAPYRPDLSIGKLMAAIALAGIGFALIVSAYRQADAWLFFLAWGYNFVGLPMLVLDRVDRDVPRPWRRVAVGVVCVWLAMAWVVPVLLVVVSIALWPFLGLTPIHGKPPAKIIPVAPKSVDPASTSILVEP